MTIKTDSKTPKVLPRPARRKAEPRAASAVWKPDEVGLTRQELRDIIIDLIG
jgi:hypothetical protein